MSVNSRKTRAWLLSTTLNTDAGVSFLNYSKCSGNISHVQIVRKAVNHDWKLSKHPGSFLYRKALSLHTCVPLAQRQRVRIGGYMGG